MNKLTCLKAGTVVVGLTVAGTANAEPLRLGVSTWVGFGPLYIADDKGFFEKAGVEIELVTIDAQKERFAELVAGNLDGLATSVDTMLNYLSEEQGYRYLFAVDDSKGGDGIIASSDIQSIADLAGKTVSYREGSVAQFAIGVLLREAGLSFADIESVNMGSSDGGKAFFAKEVDAAFTGEPWLTQAGDVDDGHVLWDSSDSPGLIVDIVMTTPEALEARGEDFKALYRAWLKGLEYQRANEKEADAIMAKGLGGWLEDPAVVASARSGIVYYDDAMNRAYIGTAEAPGGIVDTITSALELGKQTGMFDHNVQPADLVAFEIVNQ